MKVEYYSYVQQNGCLVYIKGNGEYTDKFEIKDQSSLPAGFHNDEDDKIYTQVYITSDKEVKCISLDDYKTKESVVSSCIENSANYVKETKRYNSHIEAGKIEYYLLHIGEYPLFIKAFFEKCYGKYLVISNIIVDPFKSINIKYIEFSDGIWNLLQYGEYPHITFDVFGGTEIPLFKKPTKRGVFYEKISLSDFNRLVDEYKKAYEDYGSFLREKIYDYCVEYELLKNSKKVKKNYEKQITKKITSVF